MTDGHECDERSLGSNDVWIKAIDDILTQFASQIVDEAAKTTALAGSIVRVGDEVLVNSIPMIRNILFDAHFINDPEHLGAHLGIPRMSEEATQAAWDESDRRLRNIAPIVPFTRLISQIVIATYVQAERITGVIPDDVTDDEITFIISRYEALVNSALRTVLSFLVDTSSMLITGEDHV
jgi:hypothetical protein